MSIVLFRPLQRLIYGMQDIIALLVVGVILLLVFLGWQYYLEHEPSGKSRPPLMKLSLWTRAEGKFAVMQSIAFLEWSAFMSWTFWAQVRTSHLYFEAHRVIDVRDSCIIKISNALILYSPPFDSCPCLSLVSCVISSSLS